MRKFFLVALLAVGLGGCATVQRLETAWNVVSGAKVTPEAVYVARNTSDILIKSAANYFAYCHVHHEVAACDKKYETQVYKAVKSVRSARTSLVAFQKSHPDQLGDKGLYDALVSASDTLKLIMTEYGVPQ